MNIEPPQNEGHLQRLRSEMAAFLTTLPATLAVTLRYESGPITMAQLKRDLIGLQMRLDRRLYGRHLASRTSYWAVAETMDSNPHAHCGWHVPAKHAWEALRAIPPIWDGLVRGGTYDVQPLTSSEQWATYAVKAMADTSVLILSSNTIDFRQPVSG